MGVETVADRAIFFDDDAFGEVAEISPVAGGPAYNVKGIFEDAYLRNDASEGVAVSAAEYTFGAASETLQDPRRGDALKIRGIEYSVASVQPDGTGITELLLVSITS